MYWVEIGGKETQQGSVQLTTTVQYMLTDHISIHIYILHNILFQSVLDLTVTKLSQGTKIHSKPQIRKLTDTYRFLFYGVYHVTRKYSPHVISLVLEASIRYRMKKEGEKRGKGRQGWRELEHICALLPGVLSASGDVNGDTQSQQ